MKTTRRHGWMLGLALGVLLAGGAEPSGPKAKAASGKKTAAPSSPQAGKAPAKKPAAAEGSAPALFPYNSSTAGLTDREPVSVTAPGDFAIVALPDAQMYTAALKGGLPEMFTAQTDWIISNRVSRNIVYVTLEGDISQDGSEIVKQWRNATNALYRLEDPARTGLPQGIPYGVVVGNHDQRGGGTTKFNEYFGASRFAGRAYYGGHFGNNNDSHYDRFSAGGQDFIVLAVTMGVESNSHVLAWAHAVLQSNANRRAIVVTHSLINPSPWPTPATWTKEGPAIFDALAGNPNVFLMLCGHRHGEGRRHEAVGNGSRHVDVLLADYQAYTNGGSGFLRLLEFSPSRKQIRVKTFSPWTGQWATTSDSLFTLAWPQS